MIIIKNYKSEMDVEPFQKWFESIRSIRAQQRVLKTINKMERGLFSDVLPVGEGVQEYRIHFEKGYRIYCGRDGDELVILLVGSDKSNQQKEIENAKNYWKDHKRQKRKKEAQK